MGQDQSAYFLLPVAGGIQTLEPRANYTQLTTKPIRDDLQQQWAIEKNPANQNQLSFRHLATNKYMRATAPFKGQIALGAQQWWTPEPGDIPNAFWLKCEDYPNSYLANYYGGHDPNNTIWTWTKEMGYQYTMLWYFGDVVQWRAHRNSPPGLKTAAAAQAAAGGGGGAAEAEKAKADMETKEKELREREEKLQAQQNELQQQLQSVNQQSQQLLQQRDQLKQQQSSLTEREQKLRSGEEAAAKARQDVEGKEAAMKEKQQQVEAREKAVAEKEAQSGKGSKDSPGQVADLQRQLDEAHKQTQDSKGAEQRLKAREAELEKREQEASRREQETARREQQVQEAERNSAGQPQITHLSSSDAPGAGSAGSAGGADGHEDEMSRQRQRASQMSKPPPDPSRIPNRDTTNTNSSGSAGSGQSELDIELDRQRQAASRLNIPPFKFGQSSIDAVRGAAADRERLERERAHNAELEAQRQRMKDLQSGMTQRPVPVPGRMSDSRMQGNNTPIEMKREFGLLPRLPEKYAVA